MHIVETYIVMLYMYLTNRLKGKNMFWCVRIKKQKKTFELDISEHGKTPGLVGCVLIGVMVGWQTGIELNLFHL